jgi:glycosyltransferase involved in cell wall biosynthesis
MNSSTSILFDARFLAQKGQSGISRDSAAFLNQLIENEWSVNLLKFKGMNREGGEINKSPLVEINKSLARATAESIIFGKNLKAINLEAKYFYLSQVSPLRVDANNATCKRIIRVHDLFPITNPNWFTQRARLHFQAGLNSISKNDLLITNSNATTNSLLHVLKGRISLEQVREIPCSDTDFQSSIACKICELCNESEHVNQYFIAVGTIEPRKNYINLLAGWEKSLANKLGYKLVVVGNSGWSDREILKRINSQANVLHLKGICDYQLHGLYKNSFAFVSSSVNEGFNIPLHEARNIGTRFMLSDIEIHREFIPDDLAAWFDPLNSDSIKNAINETLDIPLRKPFKDNVNSFEEQFKQLLSELSKGNF